MIETIFKGSKYRFYKSDKGNYWLGITGSGNLFPGSQCIAPRCVWPRLTSQAISEGHSPSDFITEKPEKKERKQRASKKADRPSISIF